MVTPMSALLSKLAQTGIEGDLVAWDLRGHSDDKLVGVGQASTSGPDAHGFLAAREAAREQAGAIIVGFDLRGDSAAASLYKQIMLGALLKAGGRLVLDVGGANGAASELLQMVRADTQAGVLRECPSLQEDGVHVVELGQAWTAGTPTPSMGAASGQEDAGEGLRQRRAAQADKADEVASAAAPPAPAPSASGGGLEARCRTLAAVLFLWSCAPFLVAWAFAAWLRHRLFGPSFTPGQPKQRLNVLVTGGKMSKSSAVARAVGRDGHRVFTAEILPYRYCHTRFCTYVTKHYVLPRPTVQPKEWEATILAIVEENKIDVIIPCTAPVESSAYAHLAARLPPSCRVFAFDGPTTDELDNKYTFNQVLVRAGLPCPETADMRCTEDAVEFFRKREGLPDDGKTFIVKPSVYDPKARTEILFLPIADKERQLQYLKSRNATPKVPYVIQEVLQDPEYGCYAIYNKGELTGFEFFESAASCLVYRQAQGKHYGPCLKLCQGLGKAMNLTGQLTLDLMHNAAGDLVPIECNPRIHSAVCTLEGHRNLGAAFTDPDHVPRNDGDIVMSKPETYRYWVMDQLFLRAGFWLPKNCFYLSLAQMLTGGDAILAGDDPMPFLTMYLVQIPSLLCLELLPGTKWLKIDFCIGKIVKEGGD